MPPTDPTIARVLAPGATTSEYQVARRASAATIVVLVISVILAASDVLMHAVGGPETRAGLILGGILSIAQVVRATLAEMGYANGRSAVKVAAAEAAGLSAASSPAAD